MANITLLESKWGSKQVECLMDLPMTVDSGSLKVIAHPHFVNNFKFMFPMFSQTMDLVSKHNFHFHTPTIHLPSRPQWVQFIHLRAAMRWGRVSITSVGNGGAAAKIQRDWREKYTGTCQHTQMFPSQCHKSHHACPRLVRYYIISVDLSETGRLCPWNSLDNITPLVTRNCFLSGNIVVVACMTWLQDAFGRICHLCVHHIDFCGLWRQLLVPNTIPSLILCHLRWAQSVTGFTLPSLYLHISFGPGPIPYTVRACFPQLISGTNFYID